jgi:hypothetical protein
LDRYATINRDMAYALFYGSLIGLICIEAVFEFLLVPPIIPIGATHGLRIFLLVPPMDYEQIARGSFFLSVGADNPQASPP